MTATSPASREGGVTPTPLPESTWLVVDLLSSRVPALAWNPGRIALAIVDHSAPDPLMVAGRVADWIVHQADRVADGPATFRRFMERASREQSEGSSQTAALPTPDLSDYDQFCN